MLVESLLSSYRWKFDIQPFIFAHLLQYDLSFAVLMLRLLQFLLFGKEKLEFQRFVKTDVSIMLQKGKEQIVRTQVFRKEKYHKTIFDYIFITHRDETHLFKRWWLHTSEISIGNWETEFSRKKSSSSHKYRISSAWTNDSVDFTTK